MLMKLGDLVLISPDLTQLKEWVKARVIDVENNPFQGIVISAQTENGDIFFGKNILFKLAA